MTPSPDKRIGGRPYPWRCHACREVAVHRVLEQRTVSAKYDGRQYSLDIAEFPVNRCTHCGEATLGNEADDAINRALRDHLRLLHPEEIRENRKALTLTQKQLAGEIGCATESLSRWETGSVIQSRSYDRILRSYFAVPALRGFLAQLNSVPDLGRTVVNTDPAHAAYERQIVRWLHRRFCESARQTVSEEPSDIGWLVHADRDFSETACSEVRDRISRFLVESEEYAWFGRHPAQWTRVLRLRPPRINRVFSDIAPETRRFSAAG